MRILVTGAAGFIGAAVSAALIGRGDAVIGIDNLNDYYPVALKQARLARLVAQGGNRFAFEQLDFADAAAFDAALAPLEFDRIVHLGAQAGVRYSIENPHAYVQSNLVGHLNLLEVARHRGVAHMVYASSSSVYGANAKQPFSVEDRVDHPLSLYAATKKADELMSETYSHLYRLPLTGLRFFTVYGPWGRPDMMLWLSRPRSWRAARSACSTTARCGAISPISTISSPGCWPRSTTRRPTMARSSQAAAPSRTASTISATTAPST